MFSKLYDRIGMELLWWLPHRRKCLYSQSGTSSVCFNNQSLFHDFHINITINIDLIDLISINIDLIDIVTINLISINIFNLIYIISISFTFEVCLFVIFLCFCLSVNIFVRYSEPVPSSSTSTSSQTPGSRVSGTQLIFLSIDILS